LNNTRLFILLVFALSVGLALSQTAETQIPSAVNQQLASPDPSVRAKGFEALLATPGILRTPTGVRAIVSLLQRETALIEETLRDSGGKIGVSAKYGEGYGQYYAKVLGTVNTIGNKDDPEVLDALVKATYNANSDFAMQLAKTKGAQILPTVLDLCKRPAVGSRMQGVEMLGTIVRENRALSAAATNQIKAAASAALIDTEGAIRQSATAILAEIGDAHDIPDLELVAKNDKGVQLETGERRYFVREAAQKAIARIRQRSSPR